MSRATVAMASKPRSPLACQVDKGEDATCLGWGSFLMEVYRCGSGGACYSGMRWEAGNEGCDVSEMMYQGDDAQEPTRVLQNNNKAGRRMLTSCVECEGLLGVGLENQQQLINSSTLFFGENVILMTSACRLQA